ncbi:MAG: FAD-binding protein [Actinomycetota bacterium]|nr:FAD-binding protein [Actinomycetota bacterium]
MASLSKPAIEELGALLGERLAIGDAIREHHGRDESPLPPAPPDAVAFVQSEEEVARILPICVRYGVPVIPFGAGTSLEGHVLAASGGLCIDLTEMNEIVEVNVADLDATVQPGVTRTQLEERLRGDGLFFPVDPGADATLGGMASTGASGTMTVRYGAMRENVLSLRAVLPDGRVVSTGGRARKSSAGYDLTRLFVGAEGTLGVITQLTLRVYGIPEAISGATCYFDSVDDAVAAVIVVLQTGIPVARIEFLDDMAMQAMNDFSSTSYAVAPSLFFEFHGSEAAVRDDVNGVGQIAKEFGAMDFRSAIDLAERTKLWKARHESFYSSLALRPGSRAITTDVCVPISELPGCIASSRGDIDELNVTATTVGHVGDGNFHLMLLVDPDDQGELERAEEVKRRLVERALAVGGTCTGEHGVGSRKITSLEKEAGDAIEVMRAIKGALDPAGVMNPGKVLR